DVNILMDAAQSFILFCTSLILAISCLVYLATISGTLFLITIGVAVAGIGVYHFTSASLMRRFARTRVLENEYQQQMNSILDGVKEIFMEPKKGKLIYEQNISAIAKESFANNTGAYAGYINNQITGQILFYVLISSILLYFCYAL